MSFRGFGDKISGGLGQYAELLMRADVDRKAEEAREFNRRIMAQQANATTGFSDPRVNMVPSMFGGMGDMPPQAPMGDVGMPPQIQPQDLPPLYGQPMQQMQGAPMQGQMSPMQQRMGEREDMRGNIHTDPRGYTPNGYRIEPSPGRPTHQTYPSGWRESPSEYQGSRDPGSENPQVKEIREQALVKTGKKYLEKDSETTEAPSRRDPHAAAMAVVEDLLMRAPQLRQGMGTPYVERQLMQVYNQAYEAASKPERQAPGGMSKDELLALGALLRPPERDPAPRQGRAAAAPRDNSVQRADSVGRQIESKRKEIEALRKEKATMGMDIMIGMATTQDQQALDEEMRALIQEKKALEQEKNAILGISPRGATRSFDSPRSGATAKTVTQKLYNAKRNQTKLIYSDGSEEIVDGKR